MMYHQTLSLSLDHIWILWRCSVWIIHFLELLWLLCRFMELWPWRIPCAWGFSWRSCTSVTWCGTSQRRLWWSFLQLWSWALWQRSELRSRFGWASLGWLCTLFPSHWLPTWTTFVDGTDIISQSDLLNLSGFTSPELVQRILYHVIYSEGWIWWRFDGVSVDSKFHYRRLEHT
jgi:hypothetical protein